jgi:hypothetical protein
MPQAYETLVVDSLVSIAASQLALAGGLAPDVIAYTFTSPGPGVRDVLVTVTKATGGPRAVCPMFVNVLSSGGAITVTGPGFNLIPTAPNSVLFQGFTDGFGKLAFNVTGIPLDPLSFVTFNVSPAPNVAAINSTIP